jgi:hypothetical protein
MRNTLLTGFLTLFLTGCSETTSSSKCYLNLDYFNLAGIDEIDVQSDSIYPHYQVTQRTDGRREVAFVRGPKSSYRVIYEKKDGYWFNTAKDSTLANHFLRFFYVFPDRELNLVYHYEFSKEDINDSLGEILESDYSKRKHYLLRASVLKLDQRTEYTMISRDNKVAGSDPDPAVESELPHLVYHWRGKDSYTVKDHILTVVDSSEVIGKGIKIEQRCWRLLDDAGRERNIFYHHFFSSKEIPCRKGAG